MGTSSKKKSTKKEAEATSSTEAANVPNVSNITSTATSTNTTNTTGTTTAQQQQQQQKYAALIRNPDNIGMNRKSLLTGMYGSRGERIRHVVANGALAMPVASLELMESFRPTFTTTTARGNNDQQQQQQQDTGKSSSKNNNNNQKRKQQPAAAAAETTPALPGLDSVIRPTQDLTLSKIIVTDVFHKAFPDPNDPDGPSRIMRTVAMNRIVHKMTTTNSNAAVAAGV